MHYKLSYNCNCAWLVTNKNLGPTTTTKKLASKTCKHTTCVYIYWSTIYIHDRIIIQTHIKKNENSKDPVKSQYRINENYSRKKKSSNVRDTEYINETKFEYHTHTHTRTCKKNEWQNI